MSESSAASPLGDGGEGAVAVLADDPERTRRRRPSAPREWRVGGTSTQRWGWELVGWSVLLLGAGVLGSATLALFVGGEAGSILSRLALWVALAAAIVLAFARSRPRGLLRFRPIDLLWGLVLGVALRLVQGWLEIAAGGSGAWPVYPSLAGQLPSGWWFDQLLTGVVAAPVLEELFFRGVVLVAVYTAVRRIAGRGVAVATSAIASTGLFVLAHAVLGALTWDAVLSLGLLGLVASGLVLLTGRVWPAVLAHVVYNGTWIALATVGTLLSA